MANSLMRRGIPTSSLSPQGYGRGAIAGIPDAPAANTGLQSSGSPGIDRLQGVKESLAALSGTLQGAAVNDKKSSVLGEGRLLEMKDSAIRIEQHLALEVKRRAEADQKLQVLIDARAKELAQQLEKKVTDKMVQMHHAVDTLTKRVGQLNAELALEREKNVRLTQELRYHASQGLQDVRQAVEQERVQRCEKEALIVKKLGEDVFRLQERLDVERHAREVMLVAVKEDMGKVGKSREKSDERFVRKLREDITALKQQLKAEEESRERGEEHLAQAMEEVVQQVHSGLRALAQH